MSNYLLYSAANSQVRLRCGDFHETLDSVHNIDFFVTSPPYNIGSKAPKKVYGRRKEGICDPKNFGAIRGYEDDLPEDEYQNSQVEMLKFFFDRSAQDAAFVYNHKPRHVNGEEIRPERWLYRSAWAFIHDTIVWNRKSTHNHCPSFYWPVYELCFILKKERQTPARFKNNSGMSNVMDFRRACQDDDNKHDAPFTLELPMTFIKDFCTPGCLVCDPYSGSGTTMLASYLSRCRFDGSEKVEKYFKNSIGFFEKKSGLKGKIREITQRLIVTV